MGGSSPLRAGYRTFLAPFLVPALALGVLSTRPGPDPAIGPSLGESLATEPILSRRGVVVSSSEAASRAGVRMLEAGGNAVDAAVATAFALSAADPSESGLGGESWILICPVDGPPVAIIAPSRVPRRADVAALRHAKDTTGITGHVGAAAPTTVASLARALARYGTKSFAEVLAPAIEEAERGWIVGWSEASVLRANVGRISLSPFLGPILLPGECAPDGYPRPAEAGTHLRIPALAGTLRRLAEAGPDDFYRGRIASEIDADMRANGGFVRSDDLARVPSSVFEVDPVRGRYRDREILTVGAPAGGGVLVEALQILEQFPGDRVRGHSASSLQLFLDAIRIAREDFRASDLAGLPVSGAVPTRNLELAHAAQRAREIRPGTAWNLRAVPPPEHPSPARGDHTTQLSVVDGWGNAVSITQTLGADWGSGSAGEKLGFPYNSVLGWYDLDDPGSPAYLRAFASIPVPTAPTIVLREGAVEIVLGSPGSSRIMPAILSVIRNVVDGEMSLADAVAAPRVLWQDEGKVRRVLAEALPPVTDAVLDQLRERGYKEIYVLREPSPELASFGSVNAVGWHPNARAWEGVGDPRRRGVAAAASHDVRPKR